MHLPSFLYDAAAQNADGEQGVIFYERIGPTNFYDAGVLRSPRLRELLSSAQHCCSQKGGKKEEEVDRKRWKNCSHLLFAVRTEGFE